MPETLDQQISKLADCISNMAPSYNDATSRALLQQYDLLIDVSNQLIGKQMQSNEANYVNAMKQISLAMELIGDGSKKIDKVDEALSIIGKVIDTAASLCLKVA